MLGTDILQPTHLLLILLVALLVLGPKRLPEVGRSLGRGLRDFRQGISGVQDEARGMFNDVMDEPSGLPEDSSASLVPEPVAPATMDPALASSESAVASQEPVVVTPDTADSTVRMPSAASVTKVAPVEVDPADYAD